MPIISTLAKKPECIAHFKCVIYITKFIFLDIPIVIACG